MCVLVVSVYGGERQVVAVAEPVYELLEDGSLCRCACVFGFALSVGAADIADADGVLVVVQTVCAHGCFGSACFDCAVKVDDVVVADVGKVALPVPAAYLFDADLSPFGCGGAVDNDFSDCSHINNALL